VIQNDNIIIGFTGMKSVGKDTAADYLVNYHGYRRESFAGTLKDAVSSIFGWDRTLLEGRTRESREWRETVDSWWADRLNIPNLTPRFVLQHWGTDVCRVAFHDDIWIASLENKICKTTDNIVISDVRFPNEIKAIHRSGGLVIRIKRGPDPDWIDQAILANSGDGHAKQYLKSINVHDSESAWAGCTIDHVISNDTTIDELYQQLQIMISGPE
jgi:hypothetical protein